MLPTDSTLMRHESELAAVVKETDSAPSLGVASASGYQLAPRSVVRRMFTVEAVLPPPGVHVTSNGTPEWSDSGGAGLVTTNGAPLTVTIMLSQATPPPPRWLSRTTNLKCSRRSAVGSFSIESGNPPRTVARTGSARSSEVVGGRQRKMGPSTGSPLVGAMSYCSQV